MFFDVFDKPREFRGMCFCRSFREHNVLSPFYLQTLRRWWRSRVRFFSTHQKLRAGRRRSSYSKRRLYVLDAPSKVNPCSRPYFDRPTHDFDESSGLFATLEFRLNLSGPSFDRPLRHEGSGNHIRRSQCSYETPSTSPVRPD